MARKLPWDKKPVAETRTSSSPAPASPSLSPFLFASPRGQTHALANAHASPGTNVRPHLVSCEGIRVRSPSTSPPPEAPAQEFMTPGDDKYRMVEDELLHTAQRFTAHLHRAEYMRLKEQTRTRNAHAIREMERPVVPGEIPARARRRKEMHARDMKQRALAARRGDASPWVGTSLQGLMEEQHAATPGGRTMRFDLAPRGEAKTRAAAGCTSGGPGPTPPRERLARRLPCSDSGRGIQEIGRDARDFDGRGYEADDDEDDDDPFGVHRRRARRIQSREQMRRVDSGRESETTRAPDTIPSFL
ncbi:hypothetical protein E4U21_001971 [Claviceps maximensis]|nr:hypothetical protein E4U21_001971 [Claviceps maximensis]